MSNRQLDFLIVAVVAITLTVAWLIEKRVVLSLRNDLNQWGAHDDEMRLPPSAPAEDPNAGIPDLPDAVDPNPPVVGWPDEAES